MKKLTPIEPVQLFGLSLIQYYIALILLLIGLAIFVMTLSLKISLVWSGAVLSVFFIIRQKQAKYGLGILSRYLRFTREEGVWRA